MAFKRKFLFFQYGYQKAAAISFYCIHIMNTITAFSILLQLDGILLISLTNQKRDSKQIDMKYCVIDVELMAKRKNLRKKRTCWYKAGRAGL